VGAGLIVKIIGLVIELGDKEDVGDEYSALILFVLATILVAWLYLTNRGVAQSSGS
jgi:hypothetical protein